MEQQYFLDHIEEYLNGHLSPEETRDFEQTMQNVPSLRKAFDERKEMIEALQNYFIQQKKKQDFIHLLEAEKKKLKAKEKSPTQVRPLSSPSFSFSLGRKIAAIFVFASLLGLLYMGLQTLSKPSYPQLAQTYHQQTADKALSGISTKMGAGNPTQEPLRIAKQQLKNNNLDASIQTLKTIDEKHILYFDATLLRAITYFQKQEWQNAQQQFQRLLQDPQKRSEDTANWYLALIQLNQGNIDTTKQQLQHIISKHESYQTEAQELLSQLK